MSGEWNKQPTTGHPVGSRNPSEQYGKGRACAYCNQGLSIYNPNRMCGPCAHLEADRITRESPRAPRGTNGRNANAGGKKTHRDHGTKKRADKGCGCTTCKGFRLRELAS